jgi:hypothetical protein
MVARKKKVKCMCLIRINLQFPIDDYYEIHLRLLDYIRNNSLLRNTLKIIRLYTE